MKLYAAILYLAIGVVVAACERRGPRVDIPIQESGGGYLTNNDANQEVNKPSSGALVMQPPGVALFAATNTSTATDQRTAVEDELAP